jgi:nucleolar complex protein 3
LLRDLDVKASADTVETRVKKKDRVFRTKNERKAFKERKKIERDLAEADAQVSVEERERLQSEALKIVFSLYFRILKDTDDNAMLSVALDGIAKFARLINAEFFGDLLEALREILERWDDEDVVGSGHRSRVREELVCINTAFTLLANQGGSNIDLSFFVERFYELLPDVSLSTALLIKPSSEERTLMELIVRILDSILFSPPIAPPPARISLFYKRILTCSLQMEEKEATMFLKLLQRINSRFGKKVEGMWDREGAGVGAADTGKGVRGWELALLRQHYCSGVTQISKVLCKSEA